MFRQNRLCTSHRFTGRPLAPWWWTNTSICIYWTERSLLIPLHQPPGGTNTLCPLHSNPLFTRYSESPNDGNPPRISASLPSPLNYHSHRRAPSEPPLYTTSHGTSPLPQCSSTPLRSPPIVVETFTGCDKWPPNIYNYMWWCGQGKEIHLQVIVAPY